MLCLCLTMLFTQWSEVKATHIYGGRFEYNVFSSTANTVSYTITYRLYTVFAQQLATTQYLTVDVYLQNTTNNTETLHSTFTINRLQQRVDRNANTCFSSTEYIYTNTGTPLLLNMGSRYSIRLSTDLGNYGERIQPGNILNTLFNYEVNCCPVFEIVNGQLKGTTTFDNSKSRKSKYSDDTALLQFIYTNIDWEKLPHQDKAVKILVQFSANEQGIIDSVKVRKKFNETYDSEALRVVKSIPEWDVFYRRGQHERRPWVVSIIFSDENRQKYE